MKYEVYYLVGCDTRLKFTDVSEKITTSFFTDKEKAKNPARSRILNMAFS
jgi:hypothetical protein